MRQRRVPATFMRGGTSKALVFHARDLPADEEAQRQLFVAALGSGDPNGRQLDGMGGGISSLSKVCIVGPSSRADADVDYTFVQLSPKGEEVDLSGNCGNMSSAIGPFAVDEGLVAASGREGVVRIHNTNTGKVIVSRFPLDDGQAGVDGDFRLPGVGGAAAPIRLEFLDPGGAKTGRLLPTGSAMDRLTVAGVGEIEATLVDAANPCVFVRAADLGLTGIEMPDVLEADPLLAAKLEAIRTTASVVMGIAPDRAAATRIAAVPKVAVVAPPTDAPTLSGEGVAAADCDVTVRMISLGVPHRAVPLTGAMCVAVAARIEGSVVHGLARPVEGGDVRVAQPSGLTVVGAAVRRDGEGWRADHAVVYRTARRLMDGFVYVPAARTPALAPEAPAAAAE